jgi:hypothetical protein
MFALCFFSWRTSSLGVEQLAHSYILSGREASWLSQSSLMPGGCVPSHLSAHKITVNIGHILFVVCRNAWAGRGSLNECAIGAVEDVGLGLGGAELPLTVLLCPERGLQGAYLS